MYSLENSVKFCLPFSSSTSLKSTCECFSDLIDKCGTSASFFFVHTPSDIMDVVGPCPPLAFRPQCQPIDSSHHVNKSSARITTLSDIASTSSCS